MMSGLWPVPLPCAPGHCSGRPRLRPEELAASCSPPGLATSPGARAMQRPVPAGALLIPGRGPWPDPQGPLGRTLTPQADKQLHTWRPKRSTRKEGTWFLRQREADAPGQEGRGLPMRPEAPLRLLAPRPREGTRWRRRLRAPRQTLPNRRAAEASANLENSRDRRSRAGRAQRKETSASGNPLMRREGAPPGTAGPGRSCMFMGAGRGGDEGDEAAARGRYVWDPSARGRRGPGPGPAPTGTSPRASAPVTVLGAAGWLALVGGAAGRVCRAGGAWRGRGRGWPLKPPAAPGGEQACSCRGAWGSRRAGVRGRAAGSVALEEREQVFAAVGGKVGRAQVGQQLVRVGQFREQVQG